MADKRRSLEQRINDRIAKIKEAQEGLERREQFELGRDLPALRERADAKVQKLEHELAAGCYEDVDAALATWQAAHPDVETQLGNFVKAIGMGIINETTAWTMRALEERKAELDAAVQAEHVKVTLHEDETSIGAFYQRFAKARIDEPEMRDLLFEYFIDKVWIGPTTVSVASPFYDGAEVMTYDDFIEAKQTG